MYLRQEKEVPPGRPTWLRKYWQWRPWRFETERRGERSVCYNFDLGSPVRTPREDQEAIDWIDLYAETEERAERLGQKGWDA